MNKPALTFENLSFSYGSGVPVLRGYSGVVQAGRVMAILGPNGRGKSTLLKLLLGTLKPREGKVTRAGAVAFVPQLFDVAFGYSVLDMVLMGRARSIRLFAQPSRQDEAAALAALDRFGIARLAERPFHELSGGQRQMVVLARALVAQAPILLLDEPASALDLHNQALALEWVKRLAREDGLTVVFTTHHPHHALAVADTALLMLEHDCSVFGPVGEVLSEPALLALYGVAIRKISFPHAGRLVETLVPVFGSPTPPGTEDTTETAD